MQQKVHKYKNYYSTLAFLFIVFILCVVIFLSTILIKKNTTHSNTSTPFSFKKHRRTPPSIDDISSIASWMTFEYVNSVFLLPPDYLKNLFRINNTKYPAITIKQYSKEVNIDTDTLIKEIQKNIKMYMSSHVK